MMFHLATSFYKEHTFRIIILHESSLPMPMRVCRGSRVTEESKEGVILMSIALLVISRITGAPPRSG